MKLVNALGVATSVLLIAAIWSPEKTEPRGRDRISITKPGNAGLDFTKVGRDYLVRLHSAKASVVESALEPVIYMRIAFPNQNFREIEERLYHLASRGETRSIRYKAYLAIQVFADPVAFRSAIEKRMLYGEDFYANLAEKLGR